MPPRLSCQRGALGIWTRGCYYNCTFKTDSVQEIHVGVLWTGLTTTNLVGTEKVCSTIEYWTEDLGAPFQAGSFQQQQQQQKEARVCKCWSLATSFLPFSSCPPYRNRLFANRKKRVLHLYHSAAPLPNLQLSYISVRHP